MSICKEFTASTLPNIFICCSCHMQEEAGAGWEAAVKAREEALLPVYRQVRKLWHDCRQGYDLLPWSKAACMCSVCGRLRVPRSTVFAGTSQHKMRRAAQ